MWVYYLRAAFGLFNAIPGCITHELIIKIISVMFYDNLHTVNIKLIIQYFIEKVWLMSGWYT